MTTKYCSHCKTTLPIDNFQKRTSSKDGYHSWCSLCYNAYRRERGYNKKYRPTNYNIVRRGWESHRKTVRGRAAQMYGNARSRAIKYDLPLTISLDWVIEHLEPMICEATGVTLSFAIPDYERIGRYSPSLDQIKPREGYTPENTQVVCMMYNQAKGQGYHEDIKTMATSLLKKDGVLFA